MGVPVDFPSKIPERNFTSSLSFLCVTIADFFFQAEDGIRDLYVTGVQTCALPIYELLEVVDLEHRGGRVGDLPHDDGRELDRVAVGVVDLRSEERRVGKECISFWSSDRLKK